MIQDLHQNSTEFVYPFKLFCEHFNNVLHIKLCTQSFKSFGAIDSWPVTSWTAVEWNIEKANYCKQDNWLVIILIQHNVKKSFLSTSHCTQVVDNYAKNGNIIFA